MVARGTHPNSLANLMPPWQPGNKPNKTATGPVIAPALRRYADWSYTDLEALAHDPVRANKLPTKDVVAITWLLKAAREVAWGDQARVSLAERLDGKAATIEVNVQTNVQVITKWDDEPPAIESP